MKALMGSFLKTSARLRLLFVLASMALLLQWNLDFDARANLGPPPDGTLDQTFGTAGKVTNSFTIADQISAMAIQQDGKIVAAGEGLDQQFHSEFIVARYNVNGTLDTSFGTGGRVITIVNGFDDEIHAVAIQADGKIVVAGDTTRQDSSTVFALARYNANGSLDASFGTGGVVVTGFSGQDFAKGLAIQLDGKIVAAGSASTGQPGTRTFALARYSTNGTLDQGFGAGGRVTTKVPAQHDAGAASVAIQSDGKIVAAGTLADQQGGSVFEVARFNSDGSLDQGFGQVTTSFTGTDFAHSAAIQSDGKIVAGGYTQAQNSQQNFALARYNSNGTLDPGFGSGGEVTTLFNGFSLINGIAIQSDGKIVAAGNVAPGPNSPAFIFALARYNTNGTLDSSFGTGGQVTTSLKGQDGAQAVAIQSDGKIVAAGFSIAAFALARYNALTYDTCIMNNTGTVFQWNTKTGFYKLNTCNGTTIIGKGTVALVNSILTLTDFKPDRRISLFFSTTQLTGRATIYLMVAPGVWQQYTINDTTSHGQGCSCGFS